MLHMIEVCYTPEMVSMVLALTVGTATQRVTHGPN